MLISFEVICDKMNLYERIIIKEISYFLFLGWGITSLMVFDTLKRRRNNEMFS